MHLEDDPDEELTPLEEAPSAILHAATQSIRRMLWDEHHFQEKLCRKLKQAESSERSYLASFLVDSKNRERDLTKLEKRLLLILEERKEIQ